MQRKLLLFFWLNLGIILTVIAQNNTIPGELSSLYPTLTNLAVEWAIQGDDNMNGGVTVQFREKGSKVWRTGMPLFRVPAGQNIGFTWTNKHSGSIFDLKSGTEYEIKLKLSDPDGGSDTRRIEACTRAVPKPDKNAEYIKIKPGIYDTLRTRNGTKDKPVVYQCTEGKATYTVVMHNTVVKVGSGLGGNDSIDYAWFRNNLAIGGPTGGVNWGDYGAGNPFAADIIKPEKHCSFDYDAVGVFGITYVAKIGETIFTEVEKHGTEHILMEETFKNVEFPNPPIPEREVPDLRPKADSKVIDRGVFIPNINDNFSGVAPDCGAYESGQELPHYGPRNLESL